jgi:hypothetical protein
MNRGKSVREFTFLTPAQLPQDSRASGRCGSAGVRAGPIGAPN